MLVPYDLGSRAGESSGGWKGGGVIADNIQFHLITPPRSLDGGWWQNQIVTSPRDCDVTIGMCHLRLVVIIDTITG